LALALSLRLARVLSTSERVDCRLDGGQAVHQHAQHLLELLAVE
jgi:hypothetical protein